MLHNRTEVLVVGAGFSGLAAALQLKKQGVKVLLIEAREKAGGRVKTHFLADGTQIDLGGQWVGPNQENMLELIKQYNLSTFPSHTVGESVVLYNKSVLTNIPEEVTDLCNKIEALTTPINLTEPWKTPNALQLDRQTFRTWLDKEARTPEASEFINRYIANALLSVDASEVSLLEVLFYIKSGHGVNSLTNVIDGAQQDRIVGGLEYLAEKMAESFGLNHIYYNQPVKQIKYTNELIQVTTSTDIFYAKKIIITAPSATMGQIEFIPPLPVLKRKFFEHMVPGSTYKAHFIYANQFWKKQALSGNALRNSGYIFEIFNNSLPNSEKGILTVFSYADQANKLRGEPKEKRQKALLAEIIEIFGAESRHFIHYMEHDWCEQKYTNGCFSSHFTLNGWLSFGKQLRSAVGPIYWAGTEFASHWNGYCDGAVASGIESANRVIKDL